MTLFRLVAAILMAMLLAGASMAAVITFDDLDATTGDVSLDGISPYQGLVWTNFSAYAAFPLFPGFNNGIVSLDNASYSGGELLGGALTPVVGRIHSTSLFDFTSADLGAGYYDGLSLTVQGLRHGSLVFAKNLTVNTTGAQRVGFHFNGIDELEFFAARTAQTTDPFLCGNANCTQFTLDNLTLTPTSTSPPHQTPEPATATLVGLGLAAAGVLRRRTVYLQRARSRNFPGYANWRFIFALMLCGILAPLGAGWAADPLPASPTLKIVPGFEEPLLPTGATSRQEDEELDAALAAFRNPVVTPNDFRDSAAPFEAFLTAYPSSPWRMAVLTNLGIGYYRAGYFSRAMAAWQQAWQAGRHATMPLAKALTDRAVGELARMHARLGHADDLDKLFADLGSRPISGPATEMMTGAREGLWMFRNDPGRSYLCGPMALKSLLVFRKAEADKIAAMDEQRSGLHGFDLEQVSQLAKAQGLRHTLVYRTSGQPVPVPSIVNWKLHHYAAIVDEQAGRYHVQDPTFASGDAWLTQAAINEEASGYFLVPTDDHANAPWRMATIEEARQVYGMGFTTQSQPGSTTPGDDSLNGNPGCGMCTIDAKTMLVSLNLNDTPIGYQPPKGPAVRIQLTYNQREASQPAVFSFFNVGPKWTLNVLSWVQDNPGSPGSSVLRYVAGGGSINYSSGYSYHPTTGAFSPERKGQAVLVRIPATGAVTSYELRLPDGGKQVFAHADGATHTPRRIFLSQIVDSAGNALSFSYDGQLRLASISDATGRMTTFSYALAGRPLLVTSITDPFGRHADLSYDANGRLASITDVLGLTSAFAYDAAGLVNAMTTPYGTSHFVYGNGANNTRYLETTDPLGFTDRLEFRHVAPGIPSSDPVAPSGLGIGNVYLNYRNTFYWDKNIYPVTRTDYSKATITHWLHNPASQTSPIVESTKQPLERRVWYTYPGQSGTHVEGTAATPKAIARVLDDGSTQASKFTYNAMGRPLTLTDPKGRITTLTYAANHIDLLTVRQGSVTIATFGNYNSQHQPQSFTDAAGQTWHYTYAASGQVTSMTNPLSQSTSHAYDAAGRLISITNANGRTALTLSYDDFDRVATRTDSEGHTVSYAYDAMDRLTSATYLDGTSEQFAWDRLDLAAVTDRQGRSTAYSYDANRRLIAFTDPLGQQTMFGYYPNGKLMTLTDAKGNTTSWSRDLQSRVTAKHYADGTTDATTYEATTSRVKALTDALSQVKRFTYGLDDRLTGLTYTNAVHPTPAVSFAYDSVFPRQTAMTDGSGTTQYQYRSVGVLGALQLASADGPYNNDTISYQYDALGRIVNRSVGTSTEHFAHDAIGRLIGTTNDLGPLSYGYLGETGQLVSRALGAIVGTTWSYDTNTNDRRLIAIVNSGATRGYQYTTTPKMQITAIAETAGPSTAFAPQIWRYGYDAADRLLDAQAASGARYAYTYDAADNITSFHAPTGSAFASYNPVNQLTVFNGQLTAYDAAGNLTDDAQRTYHWDAEGRLVGIDYKAQPGRKTTFRYDGLGRRTAIIETSASGTVETRYLWCGLRLCQARSASDAVARRYFFEGEVWPAAGSRLYYAQDHLGSVRDVLVAQNGARVASYDYDPYGNPTQSAGRISVDFRYAGMFYHQPSGLYLTQYRAYDPRTGRWLSRDPIGEEGGINLYGYVGGSPLSRSDPSGLITITAGGSLRIPGWLKHVIPSFIGSGGSAGVAIQITKNGSFCPDVGAYWNGQGGGQDIGIGKGSFDLGVEGGGISDIAGRGFNYSGHWGLWGGTANFDWAGDFAGVQINWGPGYYGGGSGSIGDSWSLRGGLSSSSK